MTNPKAKASDSAKVFEALRDACARIDKVIYIAGSAAESFPEDLEEFFQEEDETVIERCLGKVPDFVDLDDRYELADTVLEWLHEAGLMGYLVKVATPVMQRVTKNGCSYSWGYYNTHWVYGETMDEAIAKGLAWVQERRDAEDAKAEQMNGVDIDAAQAKREGGAA